MEDLKTLYLDKGLSVAQLSDMYNCSRILIQQKLKKLGVSVSWFNRREYTEEEKHFYEKIDTYKKQHTCEDVLKKRIVLCENMLSHIKYDVSLEWLLSFEDIEKLKFLNKSLSRSRDCKGFTTNLYKEFIEKFYYDEQFNVLYDRWIKNKKDKYMKPSLDHIVPRCKGGSLTDLNNLQFLSWLENRMKRDLSWEEWIIMKKNIRKYL